MSDSFVVIDDADVKHLDYDLSNKWFPDTFDDSSAYDGTIHEGLSGATATVQFQGTVIGVFGFVYQVSNSTPPVVEFSLDGSVVQTTTALNNGTTDYDFPFLALGDIDGSVEHTLGINVLNATNDYPFVLDYILYVPTGAAASAGSQTLTTTAFAFATASGSVAQDASSHSSATPVGPIVGGVIGGLALLIATGIAIWFMCFRHRNQNRQPFFYASSAKAADLLGEETKPLPYDLPPQSFAAPTSERPGSSFYPPPQSVTSAQTLSHYTSPPSGLGHPSQPVHSTYTPSEAPTSDYTSSSSAAASGSTPRVTTSPNQPRSKAAEAGLLSVPQQATFHADSGIRFNQNGEPEPVAGSSNVLAAPEELGDVPPSYSAA